MRGSAEDDQVKRLKWLLFFKAALWILIVIVVLAIINNFLPPWLDNRFFAGWLAAFITMHYKAKAAELTRKTLHRRTK